MMHDGAVYPNYAGLTIEDFVELLNRDFSGVGTWTFRDNGGSCDDDERRREVWLKCNNWWVGVFRHVKTSRSADERGHLVFGCFEVEGSTSEATQRAVQLAFGRLQATGIDTYVALARNGIDTVLFAFPEAHIRDEFVERSGIELTVHDITDFDTIDGAIAFVDEHIR